MWVCVCVCECHALAPASVTVSPIVAVGMVMGVVGAFNITGAAITACVTQAVTVTVSVCGCCVACVSVRVRHVV